MKPQTKIPAQWPRKFPCKIAFVAEAPGDEEECFGKPLVGPSGRLFNQMLQVAGIDRDACLVTNVFDEMLPDNDVANWCGTPMERKSWEGYNLPPICSGAKKHYLRPEYETHLTRLAEEIRKSGANIVVPLGGTALWAFTGFSAIMVRRGAVDQASMVVPGIKILPTLHPAAVLRQYNGFPVVVMDLMKAAETSSTKRVVYTERELWLEPGLEDIEAFKREVSNAEYLSIDIETIPGFRHMTCIGFSDGVRRGICIPFVDSRKVNNSYWKTQEEEVKAVELVKALCALPMPKLGQNFAGYDIRWLLDEFGIPVVNYLEDTMLEHHALFPELRKDLGFLGACYAKEQAWKTLRTDKAVKREE
jgi:uracil-DNA glycosylase